MCNNNMAAEEKMKMMAKKMEIMQVCMMQMMLGHSIQHNSNDNVGHNPGK